MDDEERHVNAEGPPSRDVARLVVALIVLSGLACAAGILALRRSQVRPAAAQLMAATEQAAASPNAVARRPEQPAVPKPVAPEPPPEAAADDGATLTMLASDARPPQGLPQAALTRAWSERSPALQRCLQDTARAKQLAGETLDPLQLEVELAVEPSGRVEHVALRGDAPQTLASCLEARLSEAEFPRAETPSTFRYPLLLRPNVISP